jgi:hypothetical protein
MVSSQDIPARVYKIERAALTKMKKKFARGNIHPIF